MVGRRRGRTVRVVVAVTVDELIARLDAMWRKVLRPPWYVRLYRWLFGRPLWVMQTNYEPAPVGGIDASPAEHWKNNITPQRPLQEEYDRCKRNTNPPTKETPAMSKPARFAYINAGHRFDFYDDHTKVFALDDPTGMPLEAFPAVVAVGEPTAPASGYDQGIGLYLVDGKPVSKEYYEGWAEAYGHNVDPISPLTFPKDTFDIGKVPDAPWPWADNAGKANPDKLVGGVQPDMTGAAAGPFKLWPTEDDRLAARRRWDDKNVKWIGGDGSDSDVRVALASLNEAGGSGVKAIDLLWSKGYRWNAERGRWLRGDEDIVRGQRADSVTREVGIGDLHKRLERVERILHEKEYAKHDH